MLLNTKWIDTIINTGLDEIEISLDGLSFEENNFIRRGCDFDKVAKNVHHLIEMKKKQKSELPIIHGEWCLTPVYKHNGLHIAGSSV